MSGQLATESQRDCPALVQRFNAANAPCYLLQRYAKEAELVVPSLYEKIKMRNPFSSPSFDFAYGGVSIQFTIPTLKSHTENGRAIIAFGNSVHRVWKKSFAMNMHSWKTVDFEDFFTTEITNVHPVYCTLKKGSLASWSHPTVCRIVQKFVRYMILRGFFHPDYIYIFGDREGAGGGRAAAYVASCIPDSFAGLYISDANAAEYLTPQLGNMGVYVQLTAEFVKETGNSGLKAIFEKALSENNLLNNSGSVPSVKITTGQGFDDEIIHSMTGRPRVVYPKKIALQIFDKEGHYSLYYAKILTHPLKGGEKATVRCPQPNEYMIESCPDFKMAILANDVSVKMTQSVDLTSPDGSLHVKDPYTLKSDTLLNTCLDMKGDLALAFCIELAVPIPTRC